MFITNPCGHLLCKTCVQRLLLEWQDVTRKECANCRSVLNFLSPIIKPRSYCITNLLSSSIYHWTPKIMPLRATLPQDLITYLDQRNFVQAFRICFLLGIRPTRQHELIAPGFRNQYESMTRSSTCALCRCLISMDDCFVVKCGHFYCTVCSSLIHFNRGLLSPALSCAACNAIIGESSEFVFIRPLEELVQEDEEEEQEQEGEGAEGNNNEDNNLIGENEGGPNSTGMAESLD